MPSDNDLWGDSGSDPYDDYGSNRDYDSDDDASSFLASSGSDSDDWNESRDEQSGFAQSEERANGLRSPKDDLRQRMMSKARDAILISLLPSLVVWGVKRLISNIPQLNDKLGLKPEMINTKMLKGEIEFLLKLHKESDTHGLFEEFSISDIKNFISEVNSGTPFNNTPRAIQMQDAMTSYVLELAVTNQQRRDLLGVDAPTSSVVDKLLNAINKSEALTHTLSTGRFR